MAVTDVPVGRLSAADLAGCLALADDRGWAPEPGKWRLLFEVGEVFGIRDPAGGLAGAVAATRYGTDLAAIGMMLVAARHERRGLGGALMTHALRQLDGIVTCLFATGYGRRLYERLGFRPADVSVRYIGPLTAVPVPSAALSSSGAPASSAVPVSSAASASSGAPAAAAALAPDAALAPGAALAPRPATAADLPAIAGLDRRVFGADRREILSQLPRLAEQVLVVDGPDGGRAGRSDPAGPAIRGFAASWAHDGSLMAGPVVAEDLAVATALLTALAAGTGLPLRLEVAGRHPGLAAWAAAHGLTARSQTTFMVHGGDLPGVPGQLFGPLNVAMG
jgi:ribosomal protein S18 acetylase RimI-like enzyme